MEFINLAKYVEQSYEEQPDKSGWVRYGADNLYPQYLVNLYHSSATHGALITSISQMIFGEGAIFEDVHAALKAEEWDLNTELRKACVDLKIQGGLAFEICWSLDRSTISKVRHLPFESLRASQANEGTEDVPGYWYSQDWDQKNKYAPSFIPVFNPDNRNEEPTQVLYIKPFSPGSFYYPKPDYLGAINYVELEKEIGQYHINNILNGLAPSFAVHFKNGIPPLEERNKIRNDMERQLAGTTNAGKFIVTYSDDPERKPDFDPFPLSDADKQYQFLSEETTAKIMVGHRVTSPSLFGVMVPGKLGGGSEMKEASIIFKDDVIEPYRRILIKAIDRLMNGAGTPSRISLESSALEDASVDETFDGAQVTTTLDIITKVKDGTLTTNQAIQVLVSMLGFSREHAEQLFETPELLSQELREVPSEEALEAFIHFGEDIDTETWEILDERPVNYEQEEELDKSWNFVTSIPGDSGRTSGLDNDIVRIRYRYDPPSTSSDSRPFCKKIVRSNKIYRREDIIAAGKYPVNPGWGPQGAQTYSIWKYKGGGDCHHRWMRQTYLRKNNKKVSVAEARRIIRALPYEEQIGNTINTNTNPLVAIKPKNMVNRGFLTPR